MTTAELEEKLNLIAPNITLLGRCGQGAFGEVWQARNNLGKDVAVKIIIKEYLKKSWQQEHKSLLEFAQFNTHPNLITVHQYAECNDFFCYVMEAADNINKNGKYQPDTLAERLIRYGKLPPAELLQIITGLLTGLEKLHEKECVHRDIKPENILFIDGAVKLGDIGLLSTFEAQTIAGTPGFMAPEQFHHGEWESFTPKQDIYSVGKVLYCAMTGYGPEKYPDIPDEIMNKSYCRKLNQILRIACSPDIRERFSSAAEFRDRLEAPDDRPFQAWMIFYKLKIFCLKQPLACGLFLCLILLILGVLIYGANSETHNIPASESIVEYAIPLSGSSSDSLFFYDSMFRKLRDNWRIYSTPGGTVSFELKHGLNWQVADSSYMLLDLRDTELSPNYEIIFKTSGKVRCSELSFLFYNTRNYPNGLPDNYYRFNDYTVLNTLLTSERITFKSMYANRGTLQFNDSGILPSAMLENFTWLHTLRYENGKLTYKANGMKIYESTDNTFHDKNRFAIAFLIENGGGEIHLKDFALYHIL